MSENDVQNNTMSSLVISNDNLFAEKMNLLKEFSGQLPNEADLPTVLTEGGLFGWFKHKVTGNELNRLTEKIQDRIIEQNKTLVKVVQEISTVYDTFSALDKVYVQEILLAINTAFKAIDEVSFTNEKISEQQKDINDAQQDIKQVINQQKQIIQVLKNFKEKLEKLDHLYDIDKTFNDVRAFKVKIETLEQVLAEHKNNIEYIVEVQTSLSESLKNCRQAAQDFYSETKLKIEHLTANANKQYEKVQNDLIVLRSENGSLSKSLLVSKGISIASLTLSFALLILILIGVL